MRRRRGQSAIETVLGMVVVACLVVVVLQVLDAVRVLLQVEAARAWLDGAVAAGPAHGAGSRAEAAAAGVEARWPGLAELDVTDGCADVLPETGIDGLDRSTATVAYTLHAGPRVAGYGPLLSRDDGACAGVGTYPYDDVGGDLVEVDDGFFGAAARERLAAIYE